jgi:hypothetical protein
LIPPEREATRWIPTEDFLLPNIQRVGGKLQQSEHRSPALAAGLKVR